jgi:hypothetical protein
MDFEVDVSIGVARILSASLIMVVVKAHAFKMAGGFVFLTQTIINPDQEERFEV